MKKRNYMAPSARVVKLHISHHLLTASEIYTGELGSREIELPPFEELNELNPENIQQTLFHKLFGM